MSNPIKQDSRIASTNQKADTTGSYNAGLGIGQLATDMVSLLANGAGLAKG